LLQAQPIRTQVLVLQQRIRIPVSAFDAAGNESTQSSPASATTLDFGYPWGIYARYDDSRWAKIHKSSPEIIVTEDMDGNGQDDLTVNFGSDSVIWMRMNNSTWNAN
ncbi:MAG: hypothetical protein V3U21_02435, partial [Thermodesulfobacteriota bacterium]